MIDSPCEISPADAVVEDWRQAQQFNAHCDCVALDRPRLRRALEKEGLTPSVLRQTHPHLFADARVYVSRSERDFMVRLIDTIERIVALPAWQERVLAYAPESARHASRAAGVFLGYDFHLHGGQPRLIEINTNAGGGMLNAKLLEAQQCDCAHVAATLPSGLSVEAAFVAMFREEWALARGERPLRHIAIVDAAPESQFLAPEFELFRRLFEANGIAAQIVDPSALHFADGALRCGEVVIDLVYNRLTDFALDAPENAALREAWLADGVVLTPHPRAHACYADKRNLIALSDDEWLKRIGLGDADRARLRAGVPTTRLVTPENAETFWATRRQWFFKPAGGYGGKAAYRGDKLTRRVFALIEQGGYIAQALVPPSERCLWIEGTARHLKLDVRNFVYQGSVQLVSARLYQGQTTNFRTHGGGFAAVQVV